MKRHRYSNDTDASIAPTYANTPGTNLWTNLDPSIVPIEFPRYIPHFDIWDDVKFSKKHMQDAIITRSTVDYSNRQIPGGQPQGGIWVQSGDHRLTSIPTGYAIHKCTLGNPWVHRGDAYSFYNRLASPVTKSIPITENPFESEFSIWFLLVDLVQLPKLAISLLKDYKKLRTLAGIKNLTAKDAANHFLALQFGLAPTIADIRTFADIVVNWGLKYSKLNTALNSGFTHHEPLKVVGDPAYSSQKYIFEDMNASIEIDIQNHVSNSLLHHTTKFYFVCPELTGILSRIKQFVDTLGVLDPAVIWDVIPFSFLIDWVVDVGGWIRKNLKPQLLPADVIISDYCESIGRAVTTRVFASFEGTLTEPSLGGPWSPITTAGLPIARYDTTQYARRRQFPHPLGIHKPGIKLKNTIVTLRRALIGTALVVQRGKVRVNRRASDYRRRHPPAR